MSRPHDLGGRPGLGPVPTGLERPFSAHWKERALALASLTARTAGINGDALRAVMEELPADEYDRLDNAGRWLAVAQRCAEEAGLVAEGEVADRARRREAGLAPPESTDFPPPQERTVRPRAALPHNRRTPPEGVVARFAVGDTVTVRRPTTGGHTRVPGYLWGGKGVVVAEHGFWVFPDTHAVDGTEAPTWVYAVRFRASELWPGAADHEVCADLFEPYLEAADG